MKNFGEIKMKSKECRICNKKNAMNSGAYTWGSITACFECIRRLVEREIKSIEAVESTLIRMTRSSSDESDLVKDAKKEDKTGEWLL